MSFRLVTTWSRGIGMAAFLALAVPSISWAQQFGTPSCGSDGGCGQGCQSHHCPPAFKYCYESPPHICWHCGCAHPICNPCDLPHFGYYEPCWSPWPFPANLTHCPTPPPAMFVNLAPVPNPQEGTPRGPAMVPPAIAPTPGTTPLPRGPNELQMPRPYDKN